MKDDILANLNAKFEEYDLWDVAERFYKDYKMDVYSDLVPEVRFEGHILPSDDCFKTLTAARNAMKVKRQSDYRKYFDQLLVKKLLEIPYTQVEETTNEICKLTGYSVDSVKKWYEGNIDMFFVTPNTVKEFILYASSKFDGRIWKALIRDALVLGVNEAKRRIDGLITYTGEFAEEVLYNLYVNRPGNSYLFFPYYTDPVEAMLHLKERFDEETTSHILISNPWYLYAYKHKAYQDTWHYCHDHDYINRLVEAYEQQIKVAEVMRRLRKNVATYNLSDLWSEFIAEFETVKMTGFEYPYCPKLMRALICTVTAFSARGVIIPDEFARYNDN